MPPWANLKNLRGEICFSFRLLRLPTSKSQKKVIFFQVGNLFFCDKSHVLLSLSFPWAPSQPLNKTCSGFVNFAHVLLVITWTKTQSFCRSHYDTSWVHISCILEFKNKTSTFFMKLTVWRLENFSDVSHSSYESLCCHSHGYPKVALHVSKEFS